MTEYSAFTGTSAVSCTYGDCVASPCTSARRAPRGSFAASSSSSSGDDCPPGSAEAGYEQPARRLRRGNARRPLRSEGDRNGQDRLEDGRHEVEADTRPPRSTGRLVPPVPTRCSGGRPARSIAPTASPPVARCARRSRGTLTASGDRRRIGPIRSRCWWRKGRAGCPSCCRSATGGWQSRRSASSVVRRRAWPPTSRRRRARASRCSSAATPTW